MQQTKKENYKSDRNKYGTDEFPIVIKVKDTPESQKSAEQTANYQDKESTYHIPSGLEIIILINLILPLFYLVKKYFPILQEIFSENFT